MTMDKARSGSANHPSPDGSGPYFAGYRAGFQARVRRSGWEIFSTGIQRRIKRDKTLLYCI